MKIRTAIIPIIIVNVVIFIFQIALGDWFTRAFMLVGPDIFARPWILLTSMFLHADPFHLFFNMYVLFLFGPMIEHKIGPKRFIFIYLLAGLVAGFVSSFIYLNALGASGAIYGILGMVMILMPHLKVMPLFIPIPMDLWKALLIFVFLDLFVFSHVAVAAHIVGAVCGILYALYLKKQKISFERRFESKTHMDADDVEEFLRTGRI
jgi:hypothetical protein